MTGSAMEEQMYERVVFYLENGSYPTGLSESEKSGVRKKSKLFQLEEGILYFQDKKQSTRRQVIRDNTTKRQILKKLKTRMGLWLRLILLSLCVQDSRPDATRESERSFTISIILPSQDVQQTKAEDIQTAFQTAINDVNVRCQDSPVRLSNNFTLSTCISLNADNIPTAMGGFFACTYNITQGPVAVIAPFKENHTQVLVQLASGDEIPIISPALSRDDVADSLFESTDNFFSMTPRNLFGGSEIFDEGILTRFRWEDVALLYSDTTSSLNAIIQLKNFAQFGEYRIVIEKSIPPISSNNSMFAKSVKDAVESIKDTGVNVIVTSLEHNVQAYHKVFSEAEEQGMVSKDIAWICLSLPHQSFFSDLSHLKAMEGVMGTQINTTTDEDRWNVTALIKKNITLARTYDAVWAIALAIDKGLSANLTFEFSDNGDEDSLNYLKEGKQLLSQLKNVTFDGVSGYVRFQRDGTVEPRFDIVNIVKENSTSTTEFKFVRVFQWSKRFRPKLVDSTDIPRWYGGQVCPPDGKLDPCRRRLRVLVPSEYPPYLQYHKNREGNDRFTGWAVDVFQHIIKGCVDRYHFVECNRTWLEMLKELRRQDTEYDMILAPIPMTTDRLTDVIFTRNIRTISIRPLVLRKSSSSRGMWHFIEPFDWTVWLGIVVCFILIGFVVYALERNRRKFPDGVPGISDSLFYSFSSLTYTQDQDAVLSLPGRLFIIVVCFAVLIFTSCFTANLTVFILKTDHQLTYNTIEELVNQPVGLLKTNSMEDYLKASSSSNGHTFQRVSQFENISQIVSALRNGSIEAFVDDEGVLALLESQNTACQLAVMSATYRKAHTAFALRQRKLHEELVRKFDRRILTAWEDGYFEELDQRYFHEATSHSRCRERDLSGSNKPLDLTRLGGAFILICAIAAFCLTGSGVLTILRKYGVLRYDLDHAKPGIHATAQLIKRAVDTVSTVGSVATTPSGSKVNLYSHRVGTDGHLLPSNLSPLALNGVPSQHRRGHEHDGHSNKLPPIVRDEYDKSEGTYSETKKNPLPDIET